MCKDREGNRTRRAVTGKRTQCSNYLSNAFSPNLRSIVQWDTVGKHEQSRMSRSLDTLTSLAIEGRLVAEHESWSCLEGVPGDRCEDSVPLCTVQMTSEHCFDLVEGVQKISRRNESSNSVVLNSKFLISLFTSGSGWLIDNSRERWSSEVMYRDGHSVLSVVFDEERTSWTANIDRVLVEFK